MQNKSTRQTKPEKTHVYKTHPLPTNDNHCRKRFTYLVTFKHTRQVDMKNQHFHITVTQVDMKNQHSNIDSYTKAQSSQAHAKKACLLPIYIYKPK